jgi:glycosyltransferase involved in cell wall biosynthesis
MQNLIKILRITSPFGKGAARTAYQINRAVNKNDNIVSLMLSPREHIKSNYFLNHNFNKIDIGFNYVRTKFLGLDSIFSPKWFRFLNRIKDDYNIFHIHHLQGYFFDIRSLEILKDKNIVLTCHDFWPITGRCSYPEDCSKWQNQCGRCKNLKAYPSTFIDLSNYLFKKKKFYFNNIKSLKIVAISKYSANILKQSYFKEKEITVIYNGINTKIFKPINNRNRSKKIKLGFVANKINSKRKGVELLLELINYMNEKKYENKYEIVIIGKTSKKIFSFFRKFSFVKYKGFIENDKSLGAEYNNMDVLLNFSDDETFGKTTIEAQSTGTPVLTKDKPIFKETNIFGDIFRVSDPKIILRKVETILAKDYNPLKMHKAIASKFSIEKMARDYINLYYEF